MELEKVIDSFLLEEVEEQKARDGGYAYYHISGRWLHILTGEGRERVERGVRSKTLQTFNYRDRREDMTNYITEHFRWLIGG